LVTVASPNSRLHLVPALLVTALLCIAVAWPALAKPPADKGAPPGQAKRAAVGKAKTAKKTPPGQAKNAARARSATTTPSGKAAAPGHAKKSAPPAAASSAPGQAKQSATTQAAGGSPTATASSARSRGSGVTARASAATRRTAARRRARNTRRAAAAAVFGAAAAGQVRRAQESATSAPSSSSQPEKSTPAARDKKAKGEPTRSRPLTQRDDLPQPLRVVRDVVEVVPTPLRVLVAGLVALAILLALAAGLTLLRNRRLAAQRRELLGQVGLLQAALLPDLPEDLGASVVSVAYRPADGPGAGGDFYDVISLAGGKTGILIGDVSGHGRAALGRTALARYTLRAYVEAGLEPRESLQIAGSVLTGKLEGDFVTALVAIHDAAAGTLTYATAGHPPPIVIASPGFAPVLVGTAPPLGVGAGTGQRQTTLPFPPGAIAFFYTDGLSEARTPDGQLGAERLEAIVRELGPEVTAKQVIDRVRSSAGSIADDAAAAVLIAQDGAAIVRSRVEELELSRAELRGPMLRQFLDECGVSLPRIRAAERDAREVARQMGGAILRVRMGERAQVEVGAPDLPVRDDVTASLHQP
jgi:serine phosphatase RsbU (regulator of sigma subunit)